MLLPHNALYPTCVVGADTLGSSLLSFAPTHACAHAQLERISLGACRFRAMSPKRAPSEGVPAAGAQVSPRATAGAAVPAKKPRVAPAGEVACRMPELPENYVHQSTYAIMRDVVPYVAEALPKALDDMGLAREQELVACPPLAIKGSDASGMRNFKEIWQPRNCKLSIETAGLYEAGGNILWADMNLSSAGRPSDVLLREEPAMQQILDYADQFFSLTEAARVSGETVRLVYPDVLETAAPDINALFAGGAPHTGATFPSKLNLVAGQALLFAWYWSLGMALRRSDSTHVRALWECGLTCTVRVRVCSRPRELNVLSIHISEKYSGFSKGMTDSFVMWSRKVMSVAAAQGSAAKIASSLASQNISYDGTKASKQMVLASMSIVNNLDEACYGDLRLLEREFGRDTITTGYTKLPKVIAVIKGMTDSHGFVSTFSFVVRSMIVTLRRKLVAPTWFTLSTIDNRVQDGAKAAGWVAMTVAKCLAVKHLFSLMQSMETDDGVAMHAKLIAAFGDPLAFHDSFPIAEASVPSEDDVDREDAQQQGVSCGADDGASGDNPVATVCKGLSKAGICAGEFLYDVYSGEFDADLKTLAIESQIASALGVVNEAAMGALAPKFREFMRLASPAASSVSAAQGAPEMGVRCLARLNSDPCGPSPEEKKELIKKEREQLWNKAQAQRKKFCRLVLWTDKTKDGLDTATKKHSPAKAFSGKLNEAHRAFVFSCDLVQEYDAQPWTAFACPKGPAVEARLSFLASRSGPVDFCFMFDGRSRPARRMIEDTFEKAKLGLEETWIVYSGVDGPAGARSRKVCLASSTKEVMYCKLPVARVRLTTKPRNEFAAVGEDSTFHTTFTGVPLPKASSLPRISLDDKKAIFPTIKPDECKPAKWAYDGVPLYWNESKGKEFWRAWASMFDIKAIVDLSPGAGQLAVVATDLGIQYLGVANDERHMSWLQNIIDREALRSVGESGSAMYHEELSVHIAEHFADVLEELNAEEQDDASDDDEFAWGDSSPK